MTWGILLQSCSSQSISWMFLDLTNKPTPPVFLIVVELWGEVQYPRHHAEIAPVAVGKWFWCRRRERFCPRMQLKYLRSDVVGTFRGRRCRCPVDLHAFPRAASSVKWKRPICFVGGTQRTLAQVWKRIQLKNESSPRLRQAFFFRTCHINLRFWELVFQLTLKCGHLWSFRSKLGVLVRKAQGLGWWLEKPGGSDGRGVRSSATSAPSCEPRGRYMMHQYCINMIMIVLICANNDNKDSDHERFRLDFWADASSQSIVVSTTNLRFWCSVSELVGFRDRRWRNLEQLGRCL